MSYELSVWSFTGHTNQTVMIQDHIFSGPLYYIYNWMLNMKVIFDLSLLLVTVSFLEVRDVGWTSIVNKKMAGLCWNLIFECIYSERKVLAMDKGKI
jgi:hypothetical protein